MTDTPDRALFVLNPASGSDDAEETEATVVQHLEAAGLDVEVRRTEGEGDARRWAGEAADDHAVDLVVVAGGDGSVREAVSGVVGAEGDVVVGIVPTGTANLLARALGVPIDDLGEAADVAATGARRRIDVLRLAERDDHAVVMVDAGFDAQLVRDAERDAKDALGPLAYVVGGFRSLFDLDEVALVLEVDGERHELSGHSVLCLNIGRIGDTVVVDQDIQPDDGQLHVGVVVGDGPVDAAGTVVELVVGDQDDHDDVRWFRGQRLRVEADPPLQVQVDGEVSGETPFEVELRPAAVAVAVPSDAG